LKSKLDETIHQGREDFRWNELSALARSELLCSQKCAVSQLDACTVLPLSVTIVAKPVQETIGNPSRFRLRQRVSNVTGVSVLGFTAQN
jgi:hypothetical protein